MVVVKNVWLECGKLGEEGIWEGVRGEGRGNGVCRGVEVGMMVLERIGMVIGGRVRGKK